MRGVCACSSLLHGIRRCGTQNGGGGNLSTGQSKWGGEYNLGGCNLDMPLVPLATDNWLVYMQGVGWLVSYLPKPPQVAIFKTGEQASLIPQQHPEMASL